MFGLLLLMITLINKLDSVVEKNNVWRRMVNGTNGPIRNEFFLVRHVQLQPHRNTEQCAIELVLVKNQFTFSARHLRKRLLRPSAPAFLLWVLVRTWAPV